MSATRFVLISRWQLACQPHEVWSLLTQIEQWPQWWPQLKRVRVLHRAPVGQAGTRAAMTWRSPIGYRFTIETRSTRREREASGRFEIEGESTGDLHGHGLWIVEPAGPGLVDVTYRYEVELIKPWMRRWAPLLRNLFAWSHFAAMAGGARGMAQHLHCQATPLRNWSAGPA